MQYRVALSQDELDGGWVAECLDMPGVMSQGATEVEALANLCEAIGQVRLTEACREFVAAAEGAVAACRAHDSAVARREAR